jgi:osmoprotectant transport system substrate-binding protein
MRSAPQGWRHSPALGLFLVLVLVLVLSACGGGGPSHTRGQPDPRFVRVASFDFPESELLAELFAQALVARDIPVERQFRLGSREIVQPALEKGLVDVVPEYLASSLEFVSLAPLTSRAAPAVAEQLRVRMAARNVSVLPYAAAVDRNAIAMPARTAGQLGVKRISELAPIASTLDFIGPPECPERPACLPVLEQNYGITFRSFTAVPLELIVQQLDAGEADVGVVLTSDPLVQERGLVLLEPDRDQPRAENVVPLVRTPVLQANGGVQDALETVTSGLTTEELRGLNKRVASGEPIASVAREWLRNPARTTP